jgi:hypothetical protein
MLLDTPLTDRYQVASIRAHRKAGLVVGCGLEADVTAWTAGNLVRKVEVEDIHGICCVPSEATPHDNRAARVHAVGRKGIREELNSGRRWETAPLKANGSCDAREYAITCHRRVRPGEWNEVTLGWKYVQVECSGHLSHTWTCGEQGEGVLA